MSTRLWAVAVAGMLLSCSKPPEPPKPEAPATDPRAEKRKRLKAVHEELKAKDRGIFAPDAPDPLRKLREEREALLTDLSDGDPSKRAALEKELEGIATDPSERVRLEKKLADVYRRLRAETSPDARQALFEEGDALVRKLASTSSEDRNRLKREVLQRHAPDVYDACAEDSARSVLVNLVTSESDFRFNDRDRNDVSDFWVADVFSLQFLCPQVRGKNECERPHDPIRTLPFQAVAYADPAPRRDGFLSEPPPDRPVPYWGYYFGALVKYQSGGRWVPYDDGTARSRDRFGFYAIPAKYGGAYRMTFLISEGAFCWKKDTGGRAPEGYPDDPGKEGWTPAD